MSERQRDLAFYTLQAVLYIGIATFAIYQFKRYTSPQPVYFTTAENALKLGNEAAARKEFDESLRLRPNDPEAYLSVIQSCTQQQKPALVIEYALRAIEACKKEPPQVRFALYRVLSAGYQQVEHPPHQQRAIDAAKNALNIAPDNHIAQNEYGWLLADNALGRGPDVDTALAVLKRALDGIRAGPVSVDEAQLGPLVKAMTEDSYGWALYKNEQDADAVTALTQAIEDYPDNASSEDRKVSYYHLGMAFLKLNKSSQAANAFHSALAYDAKYADALTALSTLNTAQSKSAPPSAPR
jgi:tetratricopeptide (TPR) repeat protein